MHKLEGGGGGGGGSVAGGGLAVGEMSRWAVEEASRASGLGRSRRCRDGGLAVEEASRAEGGLAVQELWTWGAGSGGNMETGLAAEEAWRAGEGAVEGTSRAWCSGQSRKCREGRDGRGSVEAGSWVLAPKSN